MKNFMFFLVAFQFFYILTFFHNSVYSQLMKESYREETSYSEKDHYFLKKWGKGLSEVVQSQQEQPWRKATWTERIQYFISELRKGNTKIFLYVPYSLLDGYGNPYNHKSVAGYPTAPGSFESNGVLRVLASEAIKKNVSFREVLTMGSDSVRKNVIRATLSGLYNKDPRVRLIAINFLRRLGPDVMMYNHIKRALVLETVTTEWSKLRPRDIDIPTIESPRLGYGAKAWKENLSEKPYDISDRYVGYHPEKGKAFFLDGNGKGIYLTDGLYRKNERNDYKVDFHRHNYLTGEYKVDQIWTKASLLRYGADEKHSGYEKEYGLETKEYMPKVVYLYLDYKNPDTNEIIPSMYYAYHSAWEELQKLESFISRALYISKIHKGDIDFLATISKDSFRTLADQIDGESLNNVPLKSPSFKIFNEDHIHAMFVAMLQNKVVSIREEAVRFLKRLYTSGNVSAKSKEDIRNAIREARRRELLLDTVRGRHLQAEFLVFHKVDHSKLDTATIINEEIKDVLDVNNTLEIDQKGDFNKDLNQEESQN